MNLLMMFPGQGSQSVGMLNAWNAAPIRDTLAEADDALGFGLAAMIDAGPDETLNQTANTQPAMLAADIAIFRAWRAQGGPMPDQVAGHSLGEFAALVVAGCLEFPDAMRLARLRGQAMSDAVQGHPGGMAAVIGLDDDAVAALCAKHADGDVLEPVNFNAPGQVVIAGDLAAVERALAGAKDAGARIAARIPVSVPAHSARMKPAADKLAAALEGVNLSAPKIPLIQNRSGAQSETADAVRRNLIVQVHSAVRWVDSMNTARAAGASIALECGPGKVLCGLAKRIDRGLTALPLASPEALQAGLAGLARLQSETQ